MPEQIERLLLVVVHMNEQNAHDEAHALAVADLIVQNRVGLEHIEQCVLARAEFSREVGVRGKRAAQVEQDGMLMNCCLLFELSVGLRSE